MKTLINSMKILLDELEEKENFKEINKNIYEEIMWLVGGPDNIKPDVEALFDNLVEVDCPKCFKNLYPQKLKVFLGYRCAIIETEDKTRYYANLLAHDCPRVTSFNSFGKPVRLTNINEIGYKK